MSWPLSQDYNEAIQSPRTSFDDPELREANPVFNELGIPIPCSGNFADVYQVRSSAGCWAVKCFTREVANLRERYAAISSYLKAARLPFIVDFTFLEKGIRVHGTWCPVLKMQWVEGHTLNAFIREHADKPAMMKTLLQIWVRMAMRLREAGIAHADLQHGNVLLVPGVKSNSLEFKLVDYDGTFVPALSGGESGEVGHGCYQHPQRIAERVYNAEVDRFPLLLIATALDGLRVGGRALWDKFDNGDNLLFRETDLKAPVKSPLFYELLKSSDERVARLGRLTFDALKGKMDAVPLLSQIFPELLPAPKPITKTFTPPVRQTDKMSVPVAQPVAESKKPGSQWEFDDEEAPPAQPLPKRHTAGWVMSITGVGVALLLLLAGLVFLFQTINPQKQEEPKPHPELVREPGGNKSPGEESHNDNPGNGNGSGIAPPAPIPNPKPRPAPKPVVILSEASSIDDLRQALKDGNPDLKEKATALLAKRGPDAEPAKDDLAAALADPKNPVSVRRNAAFGLGNIGVAAKPTLPVLVEAIKRTQPLEVRQFAAEALGKIKYPANREAMPAILDCIENDTDSIVRQRCVWALFAIGSVDEFRKLKADKTLERILHLKGDANNHLRYDAARKLANCLHAEAPEQTMDVLLDMLKNKQLKVYNGTEVKVKDDGKTIVDVNQSGDSRYFAARALGWLGQKAADNPDVVIALKVAASDKNPKLGTEARKVLKDLKVNIEEPPPPGEVPVPPKSAKEGFDPLFNGKDLKGWHVESGNTDQWNAEGEAIVGHSKDFNTRNYLLSDKEYTDYVLQFDYKIEGGHHGFALRADYGERVPLNGSLIFDHPLIKLSDPAYDKEPTGTTHWIKSADTFVRPKEILALPIGEWHTMVVTVRGDKCTATIDDKQLVDLSLDTSKTAANGSFVPALKRKKGKIGFQTNTGTIRFRNVAIKELTAESSTSRATNDTSPALEKAEKAAKEYEKACADAKAKLLKGFDTAVKLLKKRSLKDEEKRKLIDVVTEEKTRFENQRLIPWSEPMRPYVAEYLKVIGTQQLQLKHTFDALIVRAKNERLKSELEEKQKNAADVHVMAKWKYYLNDRQIPTKTFYSNSVIDNNKTKAVWAYNHVGELTLVFPDPRGPKGAWIDTLRVDKYGKTCAGTNNDTPARRPKITAVLE